MPPKPSFKPKIAPNARARKRASAPNDGDGSDNDVQMHDDGPADDGPLFEDDFLMQERLEEERLHRAKPPVNRAAPVVGSSSFSLAAGSSESKSNAVRTTESVDTEMTETKQQAKMEDLTLEDNPVSPSEISSDRDTPMDLDHDHTKGGEDDFEDDGREKEPDYADEGDELIKEIPVYLTQQLAKHLYLFQYPVRASALPYVRQHGPSSARIKPLSQMIELELALDTGAQEYNRDRGEELAWGTNDKPLRTALDGELDDNEDVDLLKTQTLTSSLVPTATNYLAGVIRGDELHLTPFHGTVQLRPSFKYLDKIDEKRKQATRKVSDEENKELLAKQKAEQEQKAKALQVQVRSAAESEARRTNGPNRARLAEEENWTILKYYDDDTEESGEIYNRLFANHVDDLECATTVEDYLGLVSSNNSLRNVKTEN
ncbi:DNA-directed RNA polymerase III subunit RPC5 [Gryganskiella cystojenkinii]|nr:DNA-directed RNA polymerase III subunit RPC5 [Gryganskiella cystojenkinii]